jgi:hypothetical protein
MLAVLMISAVSANAIEHIGIYADANGTSCILASGFNPNVYVVEKTTTGSTGSRFYVDPGAGNSIFGFTTAFVPVGNINSDLSLAYGGCNTGTFALGTILMSLTPGAGPLRVLPAIGFATIIYTDCSFGEYPATGGKAYVTPGTGSCEEPLATQPSTWGQVKALYR